MLFGIDEMRRESTGAESTQIGREECKEAVSVGTGLQVWIGEKQKGGLGSDSNGKSFRVHQRRCRKGSGEKQ